MGSNLSSGLLQLEILKNWLEVLCSHFFLRYSQYLANTKGMTGFIKIKYSREVGVLVS